MTSRVFEVERRRNREAPVPGEPRKEGDFFVIRAPDWVNVVALTPDDQLLVIEQWRHGVERSTLEIPGGMVDPGETPAEAAARELREETGYAAESILPIGFVEPNPAIQDNRCHTFVALGCTKVGPARFDGNERIVASTVPFSSAPNLIRSGRITHALVVTGITFETLRRAGLTTGAG